ncbi:hypothetical protein HG536_0G04600 [Torulaspora globosa]|uniref:Protein YAE1 n=1 Tax=Torulaspora globosa TaxID=48254 RepID=A0A7G3ZM62_9SACH|nr:uncharacterized protein HG536_0G04600 [Torulaspora globosa]QLL34598.1 hypothetical protein HG536_0G04600 [Torulaspora globosa]
MASNSILDDVWESDSDSQRNQISYDLKKLRENHVKSGFLDGITHAKETNLQEGFDEGFPSGALLGKRVGMLVGLLQCLAQRYGDQDESLAQDFNAIQKELRINKVLTKGIFDQDLNLTGEHPLLAKWKPIVRSHCDKYSVHTSF